MEVQRWENKKKHPVLNQKPLLPVKANSISLIRSLKSDFEYFTRKCPDIDAKKAQFWLLLVFEFLFPYLRHLQFEKVKLNLKLTKT